MLSGPVVSLACDLLFNTLSVPPDLDVNQPNVEPAANASAYSLT